METQTLRSLQLVQETPTIEATALSKATEYVDRKEVSGVDEGISLLFIGYADGAHDVLKAIAAASEDCPCCRRSIADIISRL